MDSSDSTYVAILGRSECVHVELRFRFVWSVQERLVRIPDRSGPALLLGAVPLIRAETCGARRREGGEVVVEARLENSEHQCEVPGDFANVEKKSS
jgi:hypothetical protein